MINLIFILASFILQTTLFRALDFGGITPNLIIIYTASFGFIKGDKAGLISGFFCGLLYDIFFGAHLGFYALIFMYIGFLIGKLHEIFYSQNLAIPISFITLADFVYGMVCYVLLFMFRNKFDIGYYMMNIIIPEVVYTALIAILYYPLILKINNKIDDREQRSAKKFV
ncbi:rod shape-determining protein MreD [Butyrivibrio sp. X503]|uniref:rod shape-determining protein MreD n=1 Tax=Butyrivibrio sp. X503 TaxID=2364878 RepID=UPI001FAB1931|nr:rod shape-determining protein MreD [Butyrivibrio sp. X503]